MPSVSGRQHRFFGWLKSHPGEAKKRGIKSSVVNDYLKADKGRHFKKTRGRRNNRRGKR